MKKRIWIVSACLSFLLVACGKQRNQNTNGTLTTTQTVAGVPATAQTVLNANCLNQPYIVNNPFSNTCNTMRINNSAFTAYPVTSGYYNGYGNGFVNGFNRCPVGTVPTYNPQIGLYCVQTTVLQQIHVRYGHHYHGYHRPSFPMWRWNAVSFRFKFHGRYRFEAFGGGFGKHGYNGALRSCVIGTGSCGMGVCRSTGTGRVGICH